MAECSVLDLFPAFRDFWEEVKGEPLERQIELWATDYMSQWPELLAKQKKSYDDLGVDWRAVARERIFPFLEERMPLMIEARRGLLACVDSVYRRAQEVLGLDFDVLFVIYVGIGCGAGWASSLKETPACLFGLENIAECGWTGKETLAALSAHELGHLFHQRRREGSGLEAGQGPLWRLYEEGFAQRCEHIMMGTNTWHQGLNQKNWLAWCMKNKAWLAAEFLRIVDQRKPAKAFFGSWYDIRGRRECGYFLGHEVIREWERELGLEEIALLPRSEVQTRARRSIEEMVGQPA